MSDSEYVKGYRIFLKETLGEGGYATVYKAKHLTTHEELACKKTKLMTKDDLEGAEREIKILEKMKECSHVLELYDSEIKREEMMVYTFMPLMDETLEQFLQTRRETSKTSWDIQNYGKLPEGECLQYFYQFLKGIKEMHDKGVIHRDLKPDNLFLQGSTLFIGDFNLSISAEMATSKVGTPRYMCPLVLNSERGVGNYVDLWSAGLILFRMLYGFHLYDYMSMNYKPRDVADYVLAQANKIQDEGVIFPAKVILTEGTKELIKKMLNLDSLKELTAEKLLKDPIFRKYIEQEEKEREKSQGYALGASNKSMTSSMVGMLQSQIMRTSQIGVGKELTSNLVKAYQKIMLNQKARTMYIWHLIIYCDDYFDMFDQIKRLQTRVYTEMYRDHHRDQIYFMLLLRCLQLIVTEETLEALEDRAKFNVIRQQSNTIDRDIDTSRWEEVISGSEAFRKNFKQDFRECIDRLRVEINDNIEFLKENYQGLLDKNKAAIVNLGLATIKKEERRAQFRAKLKTITNSFFIILTTTLEKKKMTPVQATLAKKIIVLTHYYEKYKNTEKIDWSKAYTMASNVDLEKEEEIIKARAEEALEVFNKKSREDNIYWAGIILVLIIAVVVAIIIKFK